MSDRTREMATVRENSRILDGYYKMTLHAPVIAQRCRPGQFVFIRVGSGTAPLLRRPISICEADSIGGTLTLLYRVVGTGTDLLSAVRAGQALDVMGPIGTPFPVEGEQAILVAGGMGAAPLCMLARALHDAGSAVTVYLGCRDAAHDLCGKTLRTYGTVHTAYESEGRLVTDILPETAAGAVYACGPTAMLAKVQQWAARNGAEGYVSLEERMACGIGACSGWGALPRGNRRIEARHIPERDVGGRHVEIAVKGLLDTLETLHAHFLVGVEAGENPARQEVFFKSHHIRASVPAGKGFEERPVSSGGFEHPQRAHMVVVQRVGQSLRNRRRGVERRQHGAFQAVDVTLVFVFACAVLADQTVQLRRHREQVEVGFRPLHGIGQVGSRVENIFQPSETAIAGKPLPLFGSGRPPCLAQLERRAYRLDVVPQFGLTVKCHPLPARLG